MFEITNHQKDNFLLTSDPLKLNKETIYELLSNTYWASKREKKIIDRSLTNSLCFSILDSNKQIGFVRVITDSATFAYFCDIIIDPTYRGHGLGKWVMDNVLEHPDVKPARRKILLTKDAHAFYEKFGFHGLEVTEKYMERVDG